MGFSIKDFASLVSIKEKLFPPAERPVEINPDEKPAVKKKPAAKKKAAKKPAAKKAAKKPAAKAAPAPAAPAAQTTLNPQAAWPFPTAHKP